MSDDLHAAITHSPALHFGTFARIKDKLGQISAPVANVFQVRAQAAAELQMAAGLPVRLVGMTIRQQGKTTAFSHLLYHHCRKAPGTRAMCIADTDRKSERLFRMVETFAVHDKFPWGHGHETTQTTIKFGNGSEAIKGSAEAPRQARGETLTAAHLSEVAFWRDVGPLAADETAMSLLNALADHPATFAAMDSTPHGARGVFHDQWHGASWPAYDGAPDLLAYHGRYPGGGGADGRLNDWLRVFAAWWEFPDLTIAPPDEAAVLETLTDRERAGVRLYGWSVGQIAWRRWAIANKCRGDERRFDEEYPEDPVSAWLVSGSPVFDSAGMARLADLARSRRPEVGDLAVSRSRGSGAITGVSWRRDAGGWAHVWEHPRQGCRHLMVVDPATGEEEVVGSGDRDRHSVLVLRAPHADTATGGTRYNLRVAARIAPPCLWDTGPLAASIAQLSRYYGDCPVIVENNAGVGLIQRLRDEHRCNLAHTDVFDRQSGHRRRQIGWRATEASRDAALDVLQDLIRDGEIDVECEHIVGELGTFSRTATGRREALSGRHDDDVLALAIGASCIGLAVAMPGPAEIRSRAPDEDSWTEVG